MHVKKKELDKPVKVSFGTWTSNESFSYRLVHKWEKENPHCTYILLHDVTEPASKVKLDMFTSASHERLWKFTSNQSLIPVKGPIPLEYNHLATKFTEVIQLYSSVVPAALLSEIREGLSVATNELESKLHAVEKGEVEVVGFLHNLHSDHLKLLARLAEMQCIYQKSVTKETQRNEFSYSHLLPVLNELGFIAKATIEQSDICLFGKSLMDLYFYQECGSTVNSALVKS